MKIKPLFNRILAKIIQTQTKSVCGIDILQEEEVKQAQVISIGSQAQNCGVNKGDTIFFEPHVVAQIVDGSENYILICVEDILAVEQQDESNNEQNYKQPHEQTQKQSHEQGYEQSYEQTKIDLPTLESTRTLPTEQPIGCCTPENKRFEQSIGSCAPENIKIEQAVELIKKETYD